MHPYPVLFLRLNECREPPTEIGFKINYHHQLDFVHGWLFERAITDWINEGLPAFDTRPVIEIQQEVISDLYTAPTQEKLYKAYKKLFTLVWKLEALKHIGTTICDVHDHNTIMPDRETWPHHIRGGEQLTITLPLEALNARHRSYFTNVQLWNAFCLSPTFMATLLRFASVSGFLLPTLSQNPGEPVNAFYWHHSAFTFPETPPNDTPCYEVKYVPIIVDDGEGNLLLEPGLSRRDQQIKIPFSHGSSSYTLRLNGPFESTSCVDTPTFGGGSSHNSRYYECRQISYFETEGSQLVAKTSEVFPKTLLLGVEYECYITSPYTSYGPILLGINNLFNGFWLSKPDGSLAGMRGGIELITAPATLEAHRIAWKKFFEFYGHRTLVMGANSTGGHIHINRSFLNHIALGKLSYFFDTEMDMLNERLLFGRACNTYSNRNYDRNFTSIALQNAQFNGNGGRYTNLNLNPSRTIEIRAFKGAASLGCMLKNLDLAAALVTYCSKFTIKSCNWDLFFEWVSSVKEDFPYLNNFLVVSGIRPNRPLSYSAPITLREYQE